MAEVHEIWYVMVIDAVCSQIDDNLRRELVSAVIEKDDMELTESPGMHLLIAASTAFAFGVKAALNVVAVMP